MNCPGLAARYVIYTAENVPLSDNALSCSDPAPARTISTDTMIAVDAEEGTWPRHGRIIPGRQSSVSLCDRRRLTGPFQGLSCGFPSNRLGLGPHCETLRLHLRLFARLDRRQGEHLICTVLLCRLSLYCAGSQAGVQTSAWCPQYGAPVYTPSDSMPAGELSRDAVRDVRGPPTGEARFIAIASRPYHSILLPYPFSLHCRTQATSLRTLTDARARRDTPSDLTDFSCRSPWQGVVPPHRMRISRAYLDMFSAALCTADPALKFASILFRS